MCWTPRRKEGGGFNSYVIVADDDRGQFLTEDGQKVSLLSINGMGEIRWPVDSYAVQSVHAQPDDAYAFKYFNLTVNR